jgi:uncharacterized ferritin-like protein (DUF455 family)
VTETARYVQPVRDVNLQHYRLCHFAGRAAATYSPLIGPLPEKFLLVELVNLFMRHAQRIATRLWELGATQQDALGCPAKLRQHLEENAAAGDWHAPLAELTALAQRLPDLYEAVADGFPDVPERRPDKELYGDLAQEVRRVLAHPSIAPAVARSAPAPVQLETLLDSPLDADGTVSGLCDEPLPTVKVSARVYGSDMHTTKEPVRPSFQPTTPTEMAFYLHNQLQIEFVSIDVVMRNISDFSGLPLSFYADQARHAHDEIRHTQMLLAELDKLGFGISDFPFEIPDRFEMLIGLPLEQRLVVLSRTGESEAIEGVQIMMPHLLEQRAYSVAEVLENVLYDEVRHTWYANKWLRWLCGNDDRKVWYETTEALAGYNLALETSGSRMRTRDPDYLDALARRPHGIDPELRALAGFTDEEIALMRGLRNWSV